MCHWFKQLYFGIVYFLLNKGNFENFSHFLVASFRG